jgi:hypothetical protein
LGHGLQKLLGGGGKARLNTGKIRPSSLSRHWQKMVYRPNAEEIFGGFGQKPSSPRHDEKARFRAMA